MSPGTAGGVACILDNRAGGILIISERRRLPRPQRVLVVDDDPDMRHVWELWLTFWGFAVEHAENGLEAVTKAAAVRPQIILMDIWMPHLDGVSATHRIKAEPTTRHIPVLALSADSYPPAPQNALNAGCEAFLEKPVLPQTLLDAIRQVLRQTISAA